MTTNHKIENLDELHPEKSTTIARDLRLNLKRVLEESALDPTEAALTLLATATSVDDATLTDYARKKLKALDVPQDQIIEAAESATIMAMLNTYYRFRHMISNGQSAEVADLYKTAGLRMTALARPALGKDRFEMLALAVSVLNGCESCINAHEKTLRDAGVDANKIHDLARLASIVRGIKTLSTIPNGI
jgi:alkyl hydroperoxide reductase subunit D